MAEKRAPVQGYSAGIPWSMHLRAYDAYCKKWGPQPAMIDLEGRNCRGGFGVGELDDFIPGWREELSLVSRLEAEVEQLRVAIGWALGEAPDADGHWFGELSEDERTKPYWWRTHLRKIAGMATYTYDKATRSIVASTRGEPTP